MHPAQVAREPGKNVTRLLSGLTGAALVLTACGTVPAGHAGSESAQRRASAGRAGHRLP